MMAAAAVLIMSEEAAKKYGPSRIAYIKSFSWWNDSRLHGMELARASYQGSPR